MATKKQIVIKACPNCGCEFLYHCHHDGEHVQTVDMPIEKAIILAQEFIEVLEDRMGGLELQIESYRNSLRSERDQ